MTQHTIFKQCPDCKGIGWITDKKGNTEDTCWKCGGTGKIPAVISAEEIWHKINDDMRDNLFISLKDFNEWENKLIEDIDKWKSEFVISYFNPNSEYADFPRLSAKDWEDEILKLKQLIEEKVK